MTSEEIDKLPELDLKEIPNPTRLGGKDIYLYVLADERKSANWCEYLLTTGEVVKGTGRYFKEELKHILNCGFTYKGIGILHRR